MKSLIISVAVTATLILFGAPVLCKVASALTTLTKALATS